MEHWLRLCVCVHCEWVKSSVLARVRRRGSVFHPDHRRKISNCPFNDTLFSPPLKRLDRPEFIRPFIVPPLVTFFLRLSRWLPNIGFIIYLNLAPLTATCWEIPSRVEIIDKIIEFCSALLLFGKNKTCPLLLSTLLLLLWLAWKFVSRSQSSCLVSRTHKRAIKCSKQ